MLIAIKDITHAKGRFALIAAVVALMAFMVSMLSGLTAGLRHQSVSGVEALGDATLLVSAEAGEPASLSSSALSAAQLAESGGSPLGAGSVRLTNGDGRGVVVMLLGSDDAAGPAGAAGVEVPAGGSVVLPESVVEELGLGVGGVVRVNGESLVIEGVADAGMISHQPVALSSLETWGALTRSDGATAVLDSAVQPAGTSLLSGSERFGAVPGFSSENGSLLAMQGLLLVISALIVGVFFAVWTLQRTRELAVLRALGAGSGRVFADSLLQALIVLAAGVGVGSGAAAAVLALMEGGPVPVELDWRAGVLTGLAFLGLGLLGAGGAVARVTRIDPILALSR